MDLADALLEAMRVAVGVQAAAYAIAAVGLNLHFGFAGLLNFGHVAFFLAGAYGTAITVDAGGPLWLGVLVGIGAAVVLGLLLGLPTLRLRAEYLAITTIAAAEILRLVVRSNAARPVTNGVFGIRDVAGGFYDLNPIPAGSYGVGGFTFSSRALWVIVVGWTVALLCTLVTWGLARSPWGRVVRAIREDEDAARSLGKPVFVHKVQVLVLGGTFGALAGVLLLLNQESVAPDSYISALTFYVWTALILGGAGTVLGPIVGSIVFWFITQLAEGLLRQAILGGYIPDEILDAQDLAAVRFALVGLGLMLLMIYRPQGIFGDKRELALDAR